MEKTVNKKIPVISPLVNIFKKFHNRFKDGSIGTKCSHFIMGSGNFYHKQYVKGAIYLVMQIVFVLFMVLSPGISEFKQIDFFTGEKQYTTTYFGFKGIINMFGTGANNELGFHYGEAPFDYVDSSMKIVLFGVITIGIVFIYLFTWLSSIKSSYKADLDVRDGKSPTTFKQDLKSLLDERFHVLMLTPTCLAALIFTVLPTIFMILIAFTNYGGTITDGQDLIRWDGFKHFKDVFTGQGEIANRFLPVLGWTFIWATIATFSCYFGGILLALLINKKEVKFKKLWRTIFILTIALPQFISLLSIVKILGKEGPFNGLLLNLGIIDEKMNFLADAENPNTARITVLIVNMWLGIPYTMLQTSGILMNIPTDLYEAATIDGANKNQMFRNITLPYIIFVTTPYLISSFVGNLNSFNVIFFLTNGGPTVQGTTTYVAGHTDLLVTWLYKLTVDNGDYNLGAIIGIFTFLITSTITLITYRRSKAYNEEDTFQ